jgi:dTDP-4-dehydrorhamnose reductase
VLAARHEVTAGVRHAPAPDGVPPVAFDLEEPETFSRAIDAARAEAIVHAAALPDPDVCERDPDRARVCNTDAPERLARMAHAGGVRLIILSTDLVFGGDHAPYAEEDPPAPLLAYARTKYAGERAAQAEDPRVVVLRLPLMIGRGHGRRATASESVAWALGEGRPLRLFTDQYRTPVDADSVADAIERVLARPEVTGTFHVGGAERVSRYEIGQRTAGIFGLPRHPIAAIGQGDLPLAPRPADVSLVSRRAHDLLGWRPRPLDVAIREGRPTAV